VTRPVDLESRARLLERVTDYIVKHGLHDLSLRPMAEAVDSSPRMLLYHFGSKEELVATVLRGLRSRQLAMFDAMRRSEIFTPAAVCGAAWATISDPEFAPSMTLFFEAYSIALRDPNRFPGFLENAVEDWIAFLADPIRAMGASKADARAQATVILATYRGFMLDLAATKDRKRISAAFEKWMTYVE
jgi:AcrR family transcriptional regulator